MRSNVLTSLAALTVVSVLGCNGNEASATPRSSELATEPVTTDAAAPGDDSDATSPDGSTPDSTPGETTDGGADAGADSGDHPANDDAGTTPPVDDDLEGAGPAPTTQCSITKGSDGFFVRNSGKSEYVAYVPASYDPTKPMRLVVGLHGCGDNAKNFATWGVNPYDGRAKQQHIGISVDGASGGSSCWSIGGDDDKVLAAVDDISKCFWVHQKKVTVIGYSSGGQLAYRVGLKNASRFAGILIENSGLYAADSNPDSLLANASRKIPIAHRAHQNDTVFALSKVQADWEKIKAAGFPLTSDVVAGDHSGTSTDWLYLLPLSADWRAP